LTPEAQKGNYTYVVNGTTNQLRTVNVLNLVGNRDPANRDLLTTVDPVTQAILAINNKIPEHASKIPDTDFNRDTYTWNAENNLNAYFPTTRLDYFVTPKQQVTFTWNYRHSWQPGERRLPVPDIERTNPFRLGYFVYAGALQSTFTPKTFNDFRHGVQHSGDTNARAEYGPYYQFNGKPLRITNNSLSFADVPPQGSPVSPVIPFIDQANVTGRHFITTIYDTLTLNRGQHSITLGGSF